MFAVFFSVILAFGAVAMDQGFWLGRHRQTQAAADASARSGSLAYVVNTGAGTNCGPGTPRRAAATTALANAFDVDPASCTGPQTSFVASTSCDGAPDRPSVRAIVGQELRSFFSGAFGIASIDTQADATACVGTMLTMGPSDITSYLPIYIRSDDTAFSSSKSCFNSNGTPKIGAQCVIVRACADSNFDFNDNCDWDGSSPRSGFFEATDDDECDGESDEGDVLDEIEDMNMGFLCRVNPSSSSCPSLSCLDVLGGYPQDDDDHDDVLDAFEERLNDETPNSCDTFGEALRRVDGGSVARPGTSGGNSANTVYVQRCESGRLGVIVLTDNSGQRVKGFATVYITGCFDKGTSITSTSENECTGSHNDDVEVRGLIIRSYMPEADRGDLGRVTLCSSSCGSAGPNINVPYTTQTVE
jgi:hypothetical protein